MTSVLNPAGYPAKPNLDGYPTTQLGCLLANPTRNQVVLASTRLDSTQGRVGFSSLLWASTGLALS